MKEESGSFMSGVECPDCHGKRLKPVVLAVTVGDKNISEFCEMSIRDELKFIAENEPHLTEKQRQIGGQIMKEIKNRLGFLQSVGLDYLTLSRASATLSGGEAQRVKLANELARRDTGKTVYILDEPTTGLHIADVHRLVKVLDKLADAGNTVIVIEHNLDVIKRADYIIDLGPEGGSGGGTIVATGTPEQVAQNPNSFTGQYLKPVLERAWKLQGTAPAPVPEEPGRPAPAEEKASAQPPRKRKKADKK